MCLYQDLGVMPGYPVGIFVYLSSSALRVSRDFSGQPFQKRAVLIVLAQA
jgi:hypothetical protein